MNDNEIIKALECCQDEIGNRCLACPKYLENKQNVFCQEELHKQALDLISRQKAEIARRHHAQLFNEALRAGSSLYSTLTFDDENEVHTFPEARKIREVFLRRLRRRFPEARIMLYRGRGKSTERIHFHKVSEGIPKEVIKKQWIYGGTGRIVTLREHNTYNGVDYGADFTGLANYLFNHWTPEQGGMTCNQCLYQSICNTYASFGVTDLPASDTSPCELFKNKADFAEVVRCENCKKARKIDDAGNYSCFVLQNTVKGIHYCSYGERKTE